MTTDIVFAITKEDIYDLDAALACGMERAIHEFRKIRTSYSPMDKNYDYCEEDTGDESCGEEHYENMLLEMQNGFMVRCHRHDLDSETLEQQQPKIQRAHDLYARFHFHLWD